MVTRYALTQFTEVPSPIRSPIHQEYVRNTKSMCAAPRDAVVPTATCERCTFRDMMIGH